MIRKLRSEDRSSVIRMLQAVGNFSNEEIDIAGELIDICVEQPEGKDYRAFVDVEADLAPEGANHRSTERVAGFLLLGPTPATVGTFDMYWIAVDPGYQGRGIAQALDAFAVEFVREAGGYWLIAETSGQPSYERTRAFYLKQGYEVLARIADYYKPGDDLLIFGKRLG